jgi:hypothetical protein
MSAPPAPTHTVPFVHLLVQSSVNLEYEVPNHPSDHSNSNGDECETQGRGLNGSEQSTLASSAVGIGFPSDCEVQENHCDC